MSAQISLEDLLPDPAWVPHLVDPVARELLFRQTTLEAVRTAAFIDGRTDIWLGSGVTVPFEAAIDLARGDKERRYIFHMSFCGSTLLARLVDTPGKSLTLREPNLLVSFADWRSALLRSGQGEAHFSSLLEFGAAMLNRQWQEAEAVTIKPSSWANNLIGDLVADDDHLVYVTISRTAFATAVVRGGHDRLAFTARLAAHLSLSLQDSPAALQQAIESTDDPLGKAVRLALVAHRFQELLFGRSIDKYGGHAISFDEIESNPLGAAKRAAQALELPLSSADIHANVARWASEHSKGGVAYSQDQRAAENSEVRRYHSATIEDALRWADNTFGAENGRF
ncbi:MAG: hypothetical protein ACJ8EP_05845 [Sphingomicrobium sp.]